MNSRALAVHGIGLVTSVGLTAAESCAAFRAKISNPTETRFADPAGDWIMGHQVDLSQPWRGLNKLAKMAAIAIAEALEGVERAHWHSLPVLLCVAESDRPGRTPGIDGQLMVAIQDELGLQFSAPCTIVPQGRAGVASALLLARDLLASRGSPPVLIVAADSLVSWPTLQHYASRDRLLLASNSNGFLPGEGAGALLVGPPRSKMAEMLCAGIGLSQEAAHIDSGEPLRGDGLVRAMQAALSESGVAMHEVDYRVSDVSGEQYYFKEASLALDRSLRIRKSQIELWHPADSIGECGAVSGIACLATAQAAARKGYAPGANALLHFSNDNGLRAAVVSTSGISP
jgi:3-oxoacyl-[acyl-carrier-protein] synthase-1